MEIERSNRSTCPPVEDLSAWFDDELQSDAVEQHIMECPACHKCVQDFQTVDESLASLTRVDDDRIDRIGRNCIRQISEATSTTSTLPMPSTQPTPMWMKIAAGIAVIGLIFFMRQSNVETNSTSSGEFAFSDDIPSSSELETEQQMTFPENEHDQDPIKPIYTSSNSGSHAPSANNSVTIQRNSVPVRVSTTAQDLSIGPTEESSIATPYEQRGISLIGFGLNGSYQLIEGTPQIANSDALDVHGEVQHVWAMDDPVVPLIFLKTMLVNQKNVFEQMIRENHDRYHLKFKVTDRNLQELVDVLDKMNCELLSPDLPQPKQSSDFDMSGRTLQYDVDFVRR